MGPPDQVSAAVELGPLATQPGCTSGPLPPPKKRCLGGLMAGYGLRLGEGAPPISLRNRKGGRGSVMTYEPELMRKVGKLGRAAFQPRCRL